MHGSWAPVYLNLITISIHHKETKSCNSAVGQRRCYFSSWGFSNPTTALALEFPVLNVISVHTRWFKYGRDYLCVNKSQFVPVIFEPPCIIIILTQIYKYWKLSLLIYENVIHIYLIYKLFWHGMAYKTKKKLEKDASGIWRRRKIMSDSEDASDSDICPAHFNQSKTA
jgi:hypothetical protein